MTNLLLYKRVSQLKDFLELHELEDVSKAKLERSIALVNEIFSTLERRKGAR